jgi:hypothetical protein
VVSVNVSVKQGRQPVANLTAGDFAITDNGVAQTVDVLALTHVPIDLTLVMAWHRPPNRDARERYFRTMTAAASVRRSLLTQDRLRTVWAGADISGGLIGNDESLWAREAEVLRSNQGVSVVDGSPYAIQKLVVPLAPHPQVSVVDGLFYAIAWPVEPDRRHLVVAFTDGLDRYSVLEKETLPRLAAHSDAVLHVVFGGSPDDYGPFVQTQRMEMDRDIVSEAARRTGGTVRTGTDAARDLAAIVGDFRTSYVLQYTPREAPAPGWHELRVRVTRPGRFDVRARQGYEVGRH